MQAKRFLVSRISAEAHRQNDDLSDLEEKMLYFSESFPTLPDMQEIAREFEEQADIDAFEARIGVYSKNAYAYDRNENPEMIHLWKEARAILKTEDHLLTGLLHLPRPLADVVWLILAAFGLIFIMLCFAAAAEWIQRNVPDQTRDNVLMLLIAIIATGTAVVKFTAVGKKLANWFGEIAYKFVDRFI